LLQHIANRDKILNQRYIAVIADSPQAQILRRISVVVIHLVEKEDGSAEPIDDKVSELNDPQGRARETVETREREPVAGARSQPTLERPIRPTGHGYLPVLSPQKPDEIRSAEQLSHLSEELFSAWLTETLARYNPKCGLPVVRLVEKIAGILVASLFYPVWHCALLTGM
jgi:hypothetical protein